MTVRKGRVKAQKCHMTGIAGCAGRAEAEQAALMARKHSFSVSGVKRKAKQILLDASASSASATELISQLTETVESQEGRTGGCQVGVQKFGITVFASGA